MDSEISLNKRLYQTFGVIQEQIWKKFLILAIFAVEKKQIMIIYPAERKEKKKNKQREKKKNTTQYGFILIVKLPVALTSKGFLVLFFKRSPPNKHSLMNIEKVSPTWLLRVLMAWENTVFPTE